jgi:hypothetical protein
MANYAFYCLHRLKILPSQFLEMDDEEKAFIIAAIDIKAADDKKRAKEIERKRKR